jgi:26S proteasome regulatory subunit T1
MSLEQISRFLDHAISNRISVRLMAEQHVALSHAVQANEEQDRYVGIVDMRCSPRDIIRTCGSWVSELCEATLGAAPAIVVDGHVDATFA